MIAASGNVAVAQDNNQETIVKFHLDSKQQHRTSSCSMPLRYGFNTDCRKYILDNGCIVLRELDDANGPTYVYSSTIQPLETYTGDYGEIIGAFSHDRLAYSMQSVKAMKSTSTALIMTTNLS